MDDYIRKLTVTDPLTKPMVREAVRALDLPVASNGLDAGCGIGSHAVLLARAIGLGGHVTGLDISRKILAHARIIIDILGMSDQISFKQGDVNKLPFEDQSFDWVWSANCVGYPAKNPVSSIKELARVVSPGGKVAIVMWSSQMLLPGYPKLEARLSATSAGIAPFKQGQKPKLHPSRALSWFKDAGLFRVSVQTFAGGFHAPLNESIRAGTKALLSMRWDKVESEISKKDQDLYKRLTRPDSPDFILNLPDYYAFFTYSLFSGVVGD